MDEFEAIENECKQAAPKQKSVTDNNYRKVFQPDPAKKRKKLFGDSDSDGSE